MNLLHLLREIEKVEDNEVIRPDSRRKALRQFGQFTRNAVLAALPFAVGSASAQSTNVTVVDGVLQFALTFKYLEADFYSLAVASPGLIPAGVDLDAINTIVGHENQHVNFLKTAIEFLGKTPGPKPTFDFSGGKGIGPGPFADVFSNYETFLTLAQALEDTGVRALKGQAPQLLGEGAILTQILSIHSIEARHASHIRQMRQRRGAALKPWITGKVSGIDSAFQPAYDGEESESQGGITIKQISGLPISAEAASESFDEPLTKEQALIIIDPFLV